MITFACVLKLPTSDAKVNYSMAWVDRLYQGIKRNFHENFDFVCLTDCKLPRPYRMVSLETNSKGYWNKVELFRPGLFDGPVMYLDLDVVVCDDITNAVVSLPQNVFLLVQEPYRDIHNSSMMYWTGNHDHLYSIYRANQQAIVEEYDQNFDRKGWLGDQAYIGEHTVHGVINDYVDPNFVGWVHHKMPTALHDPSVLIFTGNQKPSNNLDMELVRKHWTLDV